MSRVIRPSKDRSREVMNDFINTSVKKFESPSSPSGYSYAAGYLQSLVLQLLEKIPAKEAAKYVKQLEEDKIKLS